MSAMSAPGVPQPGLARRIVLGGERCAVVLDSTEQVRVVALRYDGTTVDLAAGVPLVELLTVADGHHLPTQRLSETVVGQRLRYLSHAVDPVAGGVRAEVRLGDGTFVVKVRVDLYDLGALRAVVSVRNAGSTAQVVTAVPSLSLAVTGPGHPPEALDLLDAAGDWLAESRWSRRPVTDVLVDLLRHDRTASSKGCYVRRSTGTWSTADALPVGVLADRAGTYALAWQIEHNGPWRSELARNHDGLQLTLSGPTDLDHGWSEVLAPGESFTTVPVALAWGTDADDVIGRLTAYRRRARRPHPDNHRLTLIYNDYMNTLNGDPTTAKLLPLVDAAADAGAEAFCIDAGWYDDTGSWWDGVGEWQPSTTRFPGGLSEVLDRIRERGMIPGLWLEPEVVGVRSPVADRLPPEAFFARFGVRLREGGRHHLDLRHPAARAHLDEVVDRLVGDLGVGFLKLDYNVNPGAGTDRDADSVGAGLLGHSRAVLGWLDGVLDRHPELILENCGSGAMRMDFAMLSRLQLQSTTDQEDLARYAPISVAASMTILPEQAGSWAYPSPEMDDEATAYSLSLGLLGRLYLSGFLDRVRDGQRALVREAVQCYLGLRGSIPDRLPVWPLGLPAWDAPWLAIGLRGAHDTLLTVFRRPGGAPSTVLDLPWLTDPSIETLFPTRLAPWSTTWNSGRLTVSAPEGPVLQARTWRLT